jgi:hypothetical protein
LPVHALKQAAYCKARHGEKVTAVCDAHRRFLSSLHIGWIVLPSDCGGEAIEGGEGR